jgi:hypothetical protein
MIDRFPCFCIAMGGEHCSTVEIGIVLLDSYLVQFVSLLIGTWYNNLYAGTRTGTVYYGGSTPPIIETPRNHYSPGTKNGYPIELSYFSKGSPFTKYNH